MFPSEILEYAQWLGIDTETEKVRPACAVGVSAFAMDASERGDAHVGGPVAGAILDCTRGIEISSSRRLEALQNSHWRHLLLQL